MKEQEYNSKSINWILLVLSGMPNRRRWHPGRIPLGHIVGILLGLVPSLLWVVPPTYAQDPVPLNPSHSWFSRDGGTTYIVAWGDVDGDGDLDLAAGGAQQNKIYLNERGILETDPAWVDNDGGFTYSVAWGDVDGDGDLDLAAGENNQNKIYLNEDGTLGTTAAWFSDESDTTWDVAWGDVNGDGNLDLAVGNTGVYSDGCTCYLGNVNRVYLNDGQSLETTATWTSDEEDATFSIAWGDVDGDGDLDLAVGNQGQSNRVYLNEGGTLETTASWVSDENDRTWSVAWGDVDGDGNLDLAVGNSSVYVGAQNRIYLNQGGTLETTASWVSDESDTTTGVAWGDVDGDGDLDLATGDDIAHNKIYLNEGGILGTTAAWISDDSDWTSSVAWGDVNGDGDLDLAVGGWDSPNKLYLNEGGSLETAYDWISDDGGRTCGLAWGDVDGDGDLDLAAGNTDTQNKIYLNEGATLQTTPVWTDTVSDNTRSVAWGDVDGDGDLDLAVGNGDYSLSAQNKVYLNVGGALTITTPWTSSENDRTFSVAWGDVDGDGDLDLAVGNNGDQNRVYLNDEGTLEVTATWVSDDADATRGIAWGDMDGDGDLDLAAGNSGQNKVYLNEGGTLEATAVWASDDSDWTYSVAWGDMDGDGDLDLAAGSAYAQNRIYLNEGGSLGATAAWVSSDGSRTYSIAWGDADGDGDLDLAAGNYGWNMVYLNEGGTLNADGREFSNSTSESVAWGDVDGDGDLDLAIGTGGADRIKIYPSRRPASLLHLGQADWMVLDLNSDPVQTFSRTVATLAPADFYAVPGIRQARRIPITYTLFHPSGDPFDSVHALYSPDGGGDWLPAVATTDTITTNLSTIIWKEDFDPITFAEWNDLSGITVTTGICGGASGNGLNFDGTGTRSATTRDVDVSGGGTIYFALRIGDDNNPASCETADAGKEIVLEYSTNGGVLWTTINTYTVGAYTDFSYIPEPVPVNARTGSTRFRWRQPSHNPDNLDNWALDNVSILPAHVYTWDVLASNFFGQSDNVVLRLEALPTQRPITNSVPGPYQRPFVSAHTFPFRVRGTQVRVLSGTWPVANAIVYRLPVGQALGGSLIVDDAGSPFRTDAQGYLQGRGQLDEGDHLLAMVPITWTKSYTLYYTSGNPTSTGIDTYATTASGVQTLTVSADNPLILFNLDLSLEWDAHNDTIYLDQLAFNLQRASEHLYDFTNGQVALGQVNVFQNGDEWVYSHVVVQANNRLRPFAAQGGIVLTDTIDPQHNTVSDTIRYSPGQVTMGSTWNRYGNPGQSLGEDWPIILAHELSHYLLFHDDTYIGMDSDGFLVPISTCLGSAMGDLYSNPDNTEFIADEDYWQANCADTLAEQILERNEWETMQLWYPGLVTPTSILSGPTTMPFDFTAVAVHGPYTPTDTLADPTFYIDYQGGGGSSSEARAYLDRDEYVVNLGSPFGGQNRVIAHGAKPGDRLCVFDRSRAQFGCETIKLGDDRLAMRLDGDWNPIVQISPVNSTTLTIHFSNTTPIPFPLYARVFPDLGYGEAPIPLTLVGGVYSGTFELTYPAMSGNVQVWVDEPFTETDPRREAIVAYSIGGNPGTMRGAGGTMRGAGGTMRGAGGTMRGAGGTMRGAGAPIISPDGQMIFFTENPIDFPVGTFFTIQGMAGLPPLSPGRTLVGQGYNLVASPAVTLPTGSVSIQYLSNDVLVAGASEEDLTLYYWDSASWMALNTVLDTYFNLASAPSQGEGVYALMASVKIPLHGPGWNLFAYSVHATQPVSEALLSIRGYYTTVYGYEPTDTTDPWKVYDTGAPTYVNDLEVLEFGDGYWINVSQAITLHLASGLPTMAADDVDATTMPLPPATFYGVVLPGSGFAPVPGMEVTAWIDGHLCGQGRTMAVGQQVVYTINVLAEDAGASAGCGALGKSIVFQVNSQLMSSGAVWDSKRLWELVLRSRQQVYLPLVLRATH